MKEFEELEPEIVREAWNTYELEDGSHIRARLILMKVRWPKGVKLTKGSMVQASVKVQHVIGVFAPKKLRGSPNPNPPPLKKASTLKLKEIAISSSKEEWNIYRIPGDRGNLRVKMIATSMSRVVDVWNEDGDPYYVMQYTIVVGHSADKS